MLLPPNYFLERKWLRTALFSADALKGLGISRSTYERLFKVVDSSCTLKTLAKMKQGWIEARRKLGLADRPTGWRFDPQRPWRTLFSDLIPDAVDSQNHKLSYAVHVMLQIEDALLAFGRQYRECIPPTTDLYLAMGLPGGILPREAEAHLTELGAAQRQGLPRPSYPAWLGKAILRTFLFVLAAWEVTILRAKVYVANTEPFIHKYLPNMVGGKPALPMRLFLEGLQERYGLPTNIDLASFVEISTRNDSGSDPQESALRQIQEWKSGNVVPGLETINCLAFRLAPTDEREQHAISFLYAKNRFIQEIYVEIKDSIKASPQQFANEAEIISIFQEYPKWYAYHEGLHEKWMKHGAMKP